LAKVVGEPDEDTYFVGHSIGCQTIMRYLEGLKNKKVGGAVFVAGWFYLENLEEAEKPIARPWLEIPIDFSKVKSITNKFVVILSDNDHYDAVEKNKKIFEEKLNAKVIIEHGRGHFTGSEGINELPSALQGVLEISEI
jgi:predicted alpha/beta hydrolase family esterase